MDQALRVEHTLKENTTEKIVTHIIRCDYKSRVSLMNLAGTINPNIEIRNSKQI
jgi:hypothetical protein